jgi:thioredoxin domain-containing protein 5
MNIYRNGDFVEMYKGSRDYDLINSFLSKHAEPTSSSSANVPSVTKPALHLQTPRAERNRDGIVLMLDEKNFKKVVDQGPVFVKFFAPWYILTHSTQAIN